MNAQTNISRRAFLEYAKNAGITHAALPLAASLAAIGEAAAQNNSGGYKALVCIFLYGGNDHANTVVHYDLERYETYKTLRSGLRTNNASPGLAIPRGDLEATALEPSLVQGLEPGMAFALAPELPKLKTLFDDRKIAVLFNVGSLIKPTTKTDYQNHTSIPKKIFSHNDQQNQWQSLQPEGATTGWAGRLADYVDPKADKAFQCISSTDSGVFLNGNSVSACQVESDGVFGINAINQQQLFNDDSDRPAGQDSDTKACSLLLRQIITRANPNHLGMQYAKTVQRALFAEGHLRHPLSTHPLSSWVPDPENELEQQLKMVARIISARNSPGIDAPKQVFMVGLRGFDLHDHLNDRHGPLLTKLDSAMYAFYQQIKSLGLKDQVTTFTASDFGRTMSSNGDGSDHGWGGHHFIMGGAVKGKRFYGKAPEVVSGHDHDVGQGRLLPSTSVDQYAATLAKWFGASEGQIGAIAPNIHHWQNGQGIGKKDLGFMYPEST